MATRQARFEVTLTQEQRSDRRRVWWDLLDDCQGMVNTLWQDWLCWHRTNGSRQKIRDYLDSLAAWHKADKHERGDKPKLDLFALSSDLSKQLEKTVGDEFPTVNARVRTLLKHQWDGKVKNRKAAQGSLSGWMAILLGRESLPTQRRQPILFDKGNCKLLAPDDKCDRWRIEVRIDRQPRDGKLATSTVDTLSLFTRGRRMRSQLAILEKLRDQPELFKGSSLTYDRDKNKWFIFVSWDRPEADAPTTLGHTAVLRPDRRVPLVLRIRGQRSQWVLGRGKFIAPMRTQLLSQRWNRQEHYRVAGSSQKGHGRNRAIQHIERLRRRWQDFVKTNNHVASKRIVDLCLVSGASKLVFLQPTGGFAESRFLATAGKIEGRRDSSAWDWSQLASLLGYKCQQAGIELEIRKRGGDPDGSPQEGAGNRPVPSVSPAGAVKRRRRA